MHEIFTFWSFTHLRTNSCGGTNAENNSYLSVLLKILDLRNSDDVTEYFLERRLIFVAFDVEIVVFCP